MTGNIIGICGARGVGKTTLALSFMRSHLLVPNMARVIRVGFADALRDELAEIVHTATNGYHPRPSRSEIDSEKHTLHGVGLQWWGEFRRQKNGSEYWVRRWEDAVTLATTSTRQRAVIVTDDVRHRNEVDAIRRQGGVIIRVNRDTDIRPDDCRQPDHPSEREWMDVDPDFTYANTGTIRDMEKYADHILKTVVNIEATKAAKAPDMVA